MLRLSECRSDDHSPPPCPPPPPRSDRWQVTDGGASSPGLPCRSGQGFDGLFVFFAHT